MARQQNSRAITGARFWRVAAIVISALLVTGSQLWEQASQGAHATPPLLGRLAELVISIAITWEGGLSVANRYLDKKAGQNSPKSEEQDE